MMVCLAVLQSWGLLMAGFTVVVGPGTIGCRFHAGTTMPNDHSSSLHLGLATEGVGVLGLLVDLNFLHYFPEEGTITGPIFAHNSNILVVFHHYATAQVQAQSYPDFPRTDRPPPTHTPSSCSLAINSHFSLSFSALSPGSLLHCKTLLQPSVHLSRSFPLNKPLLTIFLTSDMNTFFFYTVGGLLIIQDLIQGYFF